MKKTSGKIFAVMLVSVLLFMFCGFTVSVNAEQSYLQRAETSLNQYEFLQNYGNSNARQLFSVSSGYAGAYIDDDGYLTIGTVSTANVLQTAVAEKMEKHTVAKEKRQSIRFKQQQFTYEYLNQIFDSLTEISGIAYGIDYEENRVDIEYYEESDKYIAEDLLEENGFNLAAVEFTQTENPAVPTSDVYPYPGTEVRYNYGFLNLSYKRGTIGFCAYDNQTGKYGIVTNAHVADNWDKTYKTGDKVTIGNLAKRTLGGTIDAAFIEFTNEDMCVTEQIQLSETMYYGIGDVASESIILQGTPIRRKGITTGETTGTIVYSTYNIPINYGSDDDPNYITISNSIVYSNAGDSGDSGGPVVMQHANHYFLGIHFASNKVDRGYACRASNILSQLNLSIVNSQWMINHPELWP